MGHLRKIQRNVERRESEGDEQEVPEHHLRLPVGTVKSEPVKGDFLTIPLFGWVSTRVKTHTPLVMLVVLLIRQGDETPHGTLQIELPIFAETELQTLAVLERYGWDGRVWPTDPGWPDGNGEDEESLKALIAQAGLKATFVFPPNDAGVSVQEVKVTRARGPFLMPPLPEPDREPDPHKLARLRELCDNPTMLLSATIH